MTNTDGRTAKELEKAIEAAEKELIGLKRALMVKQPYDLEQLVSRGQDPRVAEQALRVMNNWGRPSQAVIYHALCETDTTLAYYVGDRLSFDDLVEQEVHEGLVIRADPGKVLCLATTNPAAGLREEVCRSGECFAVWLVACQADSTKPRYPDAALACQELTFLGLVTNGRTRLDEITDPRVACVVERGRNNRVSDSLFEDALTHSSCEVRERAAVRCDSPERLRRIAVEDPCGSVRAAALLNGYTPVEVLSKALLEDKSPAVRVAIAMLRRIPAAVLAEALDKDTEVGVRHTLVLNESLPLEALMKAAGGVYGPHVAEAAREALAGREDTYVGGIFSE